MYYPQNYNHDLSDPIFSRNWTLLHGKSHEHHQHQSSHYMENWKNKTVKRRIWKEKIIEKNVIIVKTKIKKSTKITNQGNEWSVG